MQPSERWINTKRFHIVRVEERKKERRIVNKFLHMKNCERAHVNLSTNKKIVRIYNVCKHLIHPLLLIFLINLMNLIDVKSPTSLSEVYVVGPCHMSYAMTYTTTHKKHIEACDMTGQLYWWRVRSLWILLIIGKVRHNIGTRVAQKNTYNIYV